MGLLSTLLTLPVTGPIKGGSWVAGQLMAAAERDYYDEARIRRELRQLAARLEAGDLSEEEHARDENALLRRLAEGRRRAPVTTFEDPWRKP